MSRWVRLSGQRRYCHARPIGFPTQTALIDSLLIISTECGCIADRCATRRKRQCATDVIEEDVSNLTLKAPAPVAIASR